MSNSQINNKRIAKNTMMLYIRTIFVLLISLYTSRVILQVLGIEDYGIYQVIGGLVAMFSIISNSLSTAISRFITYEIGSGNKEKLKRIFATSMIIQIILSLIVLFVAEVIGLWFMHTKMQIPEGRMYAAQWVLHCTLITFCINLLSVPYNACIIAHEHMKTFAYVNVVEAMLKLLVCYLILISPIDRLIAYSVFLTLIALGIRIVYTIYCHRHFEESRTKITFYKQIFKEMFGFAGWNFFSNSASILNNQGVNMLMNMFFGVTVNAARGIAYQVEHAILQFVYNFTMAVNPQITKSYAAGDLKGMHIIVCRSAKFSYFVMLLMALPVFFEAKHILNIWLVEIPEYSVIFVQLSLILGLCDSIGNSGFTACMATGNLKNYALVITSVAILEFPLTWLFFTLGFPVVSTYYTYIIVKILVLIARMILLQRMVGLSTTMYTNRVFVPIIKTSIIAVVPLCILVSIMSSSILRLILSVIIGITSVTLSSLYVGMTVNERHAIVQKIQNIKSHIINKN